MLKGRFRMAEAFLENEDAIREVVQKFEACHYAPEEFTHTHHLTVACWYLWQSLKA